MKLRRASWLTMIVVMGLIAYAVIALMNMRTKVAAATEMESELRRQVEQIQEENAALQYAIDNRYDDKTIEDIARDKLGLVLPDERSSTTADNNDHL